MCDGGDGNISQQMFRNGKFQGAVCYTSQNHWKMSATCNNSGFEWLSMGILGLSLQMLEKQNRMFVVKLLKLATKWLGKGNYRVLYVIFRRTVRRC